MTLDEAIAHAREIAAGCEECADEHAQLAEWLEELRDLRGGCQLEETETLENVTAHVLECSECGRTCEHVNGDYPRCPYCGRMVRE